IEDLPDLVRHFFALAEKDGLPAKKLDAQALERLKQHRWPGNVRELENLARRLAALYPQDVITGSVIDGELAPPAVVSGGSISNTVDNLGGAVETYLSSHFSSFPNGVPPPGLYHRILREIEVPLLTAALAATRGNQIRAADLLGLNRNTLRKKIRDLDIQECISRLVFSHGSPATFHAHPSPGMTSADTAAPSSEPHKAEPRRRRLHKLLAPFAVALALLSAFLTFVVLTGLTPITPTRQVVVTFLLINAATVLLLVMIIARELWQVVQARRRGRAAARLHVQIVSLFSVIAVLPAVLVSIVANVTIDRGLDRLFSGPTRAVIQNSLIVANAYLHEHAQLIRGDIIGMANDVNHARPLFDQDRQSFRQ
ncbi:predicted protein, partial [Nematostella vectensis]